MTAQTSLSTPCDLFVYLVSTTLGVVVPCGSPNCRRATANACGPLMSGRSPAGGARCMSPSTVVATVSRRRPRPRVGEVADALFEHPRLAAIYDALDADRSDLDVYLAIAEELGARLVLDVGCGTGTFAVLLAELRRADPARPVRQRHPTRDVEAFGSSGSRPVSLADRLHGHAVCLAAVQRTANVCLPGQRGLDVTGVDPAAGSLRIAQAKPGAEHVRWLHGDATTLPPMQVDLATMTGNVAQAITDSAGWAATLRGTYDALRPDGTLVLETRDPARRAWREWTRPASYRSTETPGVGRVESWEQVTDVSGPLVSFRATRVFAADGAVLTSDSVLRFRERDEVAADLVAAGYVVDEVRDAPDRPGREFVFLARRPAQPKGIG